MHTIIIWLSLLTFLFGAAKPTFASPKDTLYFVGNIKVSKKTSYKYNLRFVIAENNTVNGYSITDPGGLYETKTKIAGKYDSVAKTIFFEEKKVLRSRVDTIKSDLCFIRATLKIKQDKMFETLTGSFAGFEPGKTVSCGKGEIKLINTKKVKKIIDDTKRITDIKNSEVFDSKEHKTTEPIKVFDTKPKAFVFTESEINVTVWDNGIIDNDKISIIANGKYLFKNYTLTATKKTLTVKIPDDVEDIMLLIVALNEGDEPPNTALIVIESLSDKYTVEVRAKLNETRTIYLARRKQKK